MQREDQIYVFPEMKLRGLVPDSYINVSVWDLDIPTIDPPVFCCSKIGGPIVYSIHFFSPIAEAFLREKNSLGTELVKPSVGTKS